MSYEQWVKKARAALLTEELRVLVTEALDERERLEAPIDNTYRAVTALMTIRKALFPVPSPGPKPEPTPDQLKAADAVSHLRQNGFEEAATNLEDSFQIHVVATQDEPTPTPGIAHEMPRALTAYADAAQQANQSSLPSGAGSVNHQKLRELVSAVKQHRQATVSRLKLLASAARQPESSDCMLKPDRDLYEVLDRISASLSSEASS